jgi:hypothetical protein
MNLTLVQRQALKADILAGDAAQAYPDGNMELVAQMYNALANPVFWGWRSSVTKDELVNSVGPDGTTFTWVGNGFITRSVGEQAAFREMFDVNGAVNASRVNVRNAFGDIFSGTGNALANRTHLLAVARRQATRVERLFATGTGSIATPGTFVVEGALSINDVIAL